jgi:hypothetical protein
MATLAMFVALGGTGYAVSTIDGGDVEDGSLSGADIRDATLQGRDVAANAIRGPDVAPNALTGGDIAENKLGTVPDAALVGGTEVDAAPIKRLAAGESKTVLKQGVLTFTAVCAADPQGRPRPELYVTSSESGEFHAGTAFGVAGYARSARRRQLALNASAGQWTTQSFSAVTESGERAFGLIGAGASVLGSDCALSVFAAAGGPPG